MIEFEGTLSSNSGSWEDSIGIGGPAYTGPQADPALVAAMDGGGLSSTDLSSLMIDRANEAEASGYNGFGDIPDFGGDLDLTALLAKQQEEDAGLLKTNQAAAKTGSDTKTVSSLLKNIEDPKVLAALVTAGMGMLSGASKGKLQEKAWKREDDIRQQEIARKNANSRPGAVAKMTWSPANASGTGLLGAKVG